jgi:feruloyl esterase
MKNVMSCLALATAAVLLTTIAASAQRATPAQRCTALAGLDAPDHRVDAAEWVPAGPMATRPGAAPVQLPAHCLFRVTIEPRPSGLPDLSYGTGIELRLPERWNGRLLFQGGGGLNGVLNPALGNVTGFPSALQRGFAVVSTDGGHRGRNNIDARFGADQQARLDFGWQAIERGVREAKMLLTRFYDRGPEYSYIMGCSTGGREAMMAAQRLPQHFDGVVAGNPSFNLTRIAMNQVYSLQVITHIAPRDAQGRPQLHAAFTDVQLGAIREALLARCDALDGLADGMINDFKSCDFHPRMQVCGAASAPGEQRCLTPAQAQALEKIFAGARNSRGEKLYGSYTWDTGIASQAWRSMHLGTPNRLPANATLGRDTLREFALTPPDPTLDPLSFDFDRDLARLRETEAINDAVATMLTTFAARGGRMIVYHGLSDQAMATGALVDWYEQLTPRDQQGPQQWARLLLVPGMTHCGGGEATDRFDMLTAIQQWVEQGRAPDRIIATGNAFPGVTRPLCPYPAVARYIGGDPADAASFSCRVGQ